MKHPRIAQMVTDKASAQNPRNSVDCRMIHGRQEIRYRILYSSRRTMEIAVHPDGQVVIKAPENAGLDVIQQRVRKRVRWISRQLAWFQQFQPRTPPRRYVSGETHLYLGRQYRLKISVADEDSVKLTRGFIQVRCCDTPSPEKVQRLLEQWYLGKAGIKFRESLDRCFLQFERWGYAKPTIHIRRMKTRWGSLSARGTLTLNSSLIRAPRDCIDYVVTHELCHLRYRDHSTAFYRLLEQVMPDWSNRKHRLELSLI